MLMLDLRDPPPPYINRATLGKWIDQLSPRIEFAIADWFLSEGRYAGMNGALVCAMVAATTDNFLDRRWINERKIPDPLSGNWPTLGRTTMREAIRGYCNMLNGARITDVSGMKHGPDFIAKYEDLDRFCKAANDELAPPEPTPRPTPPPIPPRHPAPEPPDQGTPTPPPTSTEPGQWKRTLAQIAKLVLALWFVVDWFIPLPAAIKEGVKALLEYLAGLSFFSSPGSQAHANGESGADEKHLGIMHKKRHDLGLLKVGPAGE